MIVAAGANVLRLGRWAGYRTTADRIVLVLHIGYLFVPVGFLLNGLAAFDVVLPSAGIHAWTVGAIGIMTLAVMSRATLGHSGRPLVAPLPLAISYGLLPLAAAARWLGSGLSGQWYFPGVLAAGALWILTFTFYIATLWPAFCGPRFQVKE